MMFVTFIFIFFALLFIGSLAISGWFFITRGEEIVLEDGKKRRTGKLFRGWYFFWMKKRSCKKVIFFDDDHAFELYMKVRDKFVIGKDKYDLTPVNGFFKIDNATRYTDIIRWIEGAFEVKLKDDGGGLFRIVMEEDQYVFPHWLRDPLAKCSTCFASIYGSLFYWLLIALVKIDLFEWSSNVTLAKIFFWIVFCLSVAVINTALAKKFN